MHAEGGGGVIQLRFKKTKHNVSTEKLDGIRKITINFLGHTFLFFKDACKSKCSRMKHEMLEKTKTDQLDRKGGERKNWMDGCKEERKDEQKT